MHHNVYSKHSEVPTFDSHEAHKHELQNIRNAITNLLQPSPPLHVAHIPFSQQVIKNSTHHGPNWTSSYMHMVSFPWCLKGIEHKYIWMRLSQLHNWVMVFVKFTTAQKGGDRRKGPAAKLKLGTCTLSWSFNNELSILGLIAHSYGKANPHTAHYMYNSIRTVSLKWYQKNSWQENLSPHCCAAGEPQLRICTTRVQCTLCCHCKQTSCVCKFRAVHLVVTGHFRGS